MTAACPKTNVGFKNSIEKIPSAFLITGPNIASQELLFDQLSETLQSTTQGRFVRLRSSEAGTLKSVLKKVIRSVTAKLEEDDDEDDEEAAEAGPARDVCLLTC